MIDQKFETSVRISFQFSIDWCKLKENSWLCSWPFGLLFWSRWHLVVFTNSPFYDKEKEIINGFEVHRKKARSLASKMRPKRAPYDDSVPRYWHFCENRSQKIVQKNDKFPKLWEFISRPQKGFEPKYFGHDVFSSFVTFPENFSQIGDYERKKVWRWQRIAHIYIY